jgi:cytoskeletal protein CcmA (bactofilin family)
MVDERSAMAGIGASIVIKGDLISSEDTTIAGQVHGDVTVEGHTLTLASRSSIRGNIAAAAVAVHGEVIGTITSPGKIEVGETGSVDGEIRAPRMVLTEGATVHGRIQISKPTS